MLATSAADATSSSVARPIAPSESSAGIGGRGISDSGEARTHPDTDDPVTDPGGHCHSAAYTRAT